MPLNFFEREVSNVNLSVSSPPSPISIAESDDLDDLDDSLEIDYENIELKITEDNVIFGITDTFDLDRIEHYRIDINDINEAENEDGNTLLHLSCIEGNYENVHAFIWKGFDLNKQNKKGETPFNLACFHGHLNIIKLLVKNGADYKKPRMQSNYILETSLILAVKGANIDIIKYLVEELGVNVHERTYEGYNAYNISSFQTQITDINTMFDENVKINNRKIKEYLFVKTFPFSKYTEPVKIKCHKKVDNEDNSDSEDDYTKDYEEDYEDREDKDDIFITVG